MQNTACLEIFHFVLPELGVQFAVDIHHGILAPFRLLKVFQANTEYQVHITGIEPAQVPAVAAFPERVGQFLVGCRIG